MPLSAEEGGAEPRGKAGVVEPAHVEPPDPRLVDPGASRAADTETELEEPEAEEEGGSASRVGDHRRRRLIALVLVVVVIAGGAVGAFFILRHPSKYVTFHDATDGFSVTYPRTWTRVSAPGPSDPATPLLVSAGGQNAISVRVLRLQQSVNTKNLAEVEAVTNAILTTPAAKLKILKYGPTTVNGIPGYFYLYSFPAGNQMGVHLHYFLFQGRKLSILVFQALPYQDFKGLAPAFTEVSNSFRSNPKILGPTPQPVSPGTTAPRAPTTTTVKPAG
ncbi:MAG: PsbP-related protein [Acidimicrobiales bacterium]